MPLPRPSRRPALALWALLVGAPAHAKVPSKQPTDPVRGRELYEAHCWQCHGPTGQGDGPLAAALGVPLASLRDRDAAGWSALVDVIMQGRADMPAHAEVMDRYDARRILVWLQALDQGDKHKDVQPTRGVAPAPAVPDEARLDEARPDEARPDDARPDEARPGDADEARPDDADSGGGPPDEEQR